MEQNGFSSRLQKVIYSFIPPEEYQANKLAKELEISETAVSNYMDKDRKPQLYEFTKFVSYIKKNIPNFNTDYLLGLSDSMIKVDNNMLGLNNNSLRQLQKIQDRHLIKELNQILSNEQLSFLLLKFKELNNYILEEEIDRIILLSKYAKHSHTYLYQKNNDFIDNDSHFNYVQTNRDNEFINSLFHNQNLDIHKLYLNKAIDKFVNDIALTKTNQMLFNKLKKLQDENGNPKQDIDMEEYFSLLFLVENYEKLSKLNNN